MPGPRGTKRKSTATANSTDPEVSTSPGMDLDDDRGRTRNLLTGLVYALSWYAELVEVYACSSEYILENYTDTILSETRPQ